MCETQVMDLFCQGFSLFNWHNFLNLPAELQYYILQNMINSLLTSRNRSMNDLRYLTIAALMFAVACSSLPKNNKPEKAKETSSTATDLTEALQIGEEVFSQYCVVCHMKDGAGIPGLNPPLIKTEWVNGDKSQLIKIILNGSQGGQYPVNGEVYPGAMTPHDFLSNKQIAGLLTYVRSNFENSADAVTPEEVAEVRNAGGE